MALSVRSSCVMAREHFEIVDPCLWTHRLWSGVQASGSEFSEATNHPTWTTSGTSSLMISDSISIGAGLGSAFIALGSVETRPAGPLRGQKCVENRRCISARRLPPTAYFLRPSYDKSYSTKMLASCGPSWPRLFEESTLPRPQISCGQRKRRRPSTRIIRPFMPLGVRSQLLPHHRTPPGCGQKTGAPPHLGRDAAGPSESLLMKRLHSRAPCSFRTSHRVLLAGR